MTEPAIFFDFDGPIVDNRYKYHALHRDVLAELGCKTHCDLETYWQAKRDRIPEAEILRRLGVERFTEAYSKLRLERIEHGRYARFDRLWPGARAHLQALGQRFELFVLTLRKRRSTLLRELEHLGLDGVFSHVFSEDDNAGTAEVKCRLAQSSILGREARCCFVGDTELDIAAGKRLGIATIAVTCGIRNEADLGALHPDLVVANLLEVTERSVLELQERKQNQSSSIQQPAASASSS